MKRKLILSVLLMPLSLIIYSPSLLYIHAPQLNTLSPNFCTAFCLDNGDHCVFGANQDNTLEIGKIFVNKRQVVKTTWDPSTTGEYAQWVSRHGSVTVNFVGYQMAWAGMNEAGLMISTMAVPESRGPNPDERPPFQGPFWMQYQLDNYSTVEQVRASDADIRLIETAVDHYLVCDRSGICATIEYLDGHAVYHSGETLPVKALTNSTYKQSLQALQGEDIQPGENSLWRFATAAERLAAFDPASSVDAIDYAFDTLEQVSRDDTVWSFVYDPVSLRVYFRTNRNPNIRYLDLGDLDFSCQAPTMMMDVHSDVKGDISDDLVAYNHAVSFQHSNSFFNAYENMSMSPILIDTLLWGVESFPCLSGERAFQEGLVLHGPLIPPTIQWAGMTVLHRVGPVWILLTALSLAFLFWRMAADKAISVRGCLPWVLVTIVLGPIGLLAYLVFNNKRTVN